MAWGFRLLGRFGAAEVTRNGEILTRRFSYSDPYIVQLTDTTVANLIIPKSGQQFILTGMYASADRSVNANGDVIDIYETSAADSGTQDRLLFSLDVARQTNTGFQLPDTRMTAGAFLNTDRTSTTGIISVTVWGYYVPFEPTLGNAA